ncbi:MAG: zinc-binding dehydrogenase [Rhizobiaceae bacterium]
MKALTLNHDGYARSAPDSIALTDMSEFVTLDDIEDPNPKSGEVKIKVILAAVNPSDEMFVQGLYGQPRIGGNAAGFEGVGEVVASGGGLMGAWLKGKRVAFVAKPGCPGAWSEYAIADATTCIPLKKGVSDVDGAAMIVNPLTALAMFDLVKKAGAKSFIVSAGASQLCKLMIGAANAEGYKPIAIVRRDSQIDLLKALGATHVLNCESDGFLAEFSALMRAEKPRVFLDAVANQTSAAMFDKMPNRGRWVIYGKLDEELPTILQPGQMIFQSKRIEGFWLTQWMRRTSLLGKLGVIRSAQTRFANGDWKTDVTAIIPLDEAIARVPQELAVPNGKVFIKPN